MIKKDAMRAEIDALKERNKKILQTLEEAISLAEEYKKDYEIILEQNKEWKSRYIDAANWQLHLMKHDKQTANDHFVNQTLEQSGHLLKARRVVEKKYTDLNRLVTDALDDLIYYDDGSIFINVGSVRSLKYAVEYKEKTEALDTSSTMTV